MADNHLLIFVKYPLKGLVKTRLGNQIGFQKSLDVYKFLLKTTFDRFLHNDKYRTWVFYTPAGYYNKIKRIIENTTVYNIAPQKGNDLGERLSNAFQDVFDAGAKNAVVIGSDCFYLAVPDIVNAFKKLESCKNDVVIGPSFDGGYYLLGINEYNESIFNRIEWSTDRVLHETRNRIVDAGMRLHLLEPLGDIDEIEDLSVDFINSIRKFKPGFSLIKPE